MKVKRKGLFNAASIRGFMAWFLPVTGFLAVSCNQNTGLRGSRPNIIFILADDLGWSDLPVYGNRFNEAPNLTRMAENGIRFTDAYAACPVCSPTRASIISGQYPARVGIIDFIPGHWRPYDSVTVPKNRTQYLPEEIYTIGESMRDAGYETGYFGKWHLGHEPEHLPSNQGFKESHVYPGGRYFNVGPRLIPPIRADSATVLSEVLTGLATDFIESNRDNPFFLFLAHYDVHVQLDANTDLIEKYLAKDRIEGYPCNAVYAAMVEQVDNSVGAVLDKLDETGLTENTVVLFFSDNGGLISRFDRIPLLAGSRQSIYRNDTLLYIASSNAPLRAEKGTLYEGGIREPLIICWPGRIKAGRLTNALVSSVDFFPTFADLAGSGLPAYQHFDGKSLVPLLEDGSRDPGRSVFWHYPVYHHDRPASAIRKGDWKLIQYLDDNSHRLYRLDTDISEKEDLSSSNPEKTSELLEELEEWRKSTGAELPAANPDFDPERRYEWGVHPDRQ